jgi:hypothetical protein
MKTKSDVARQRASRKRRIKLGLKRYDIWVHPEAWPRVKQFVAQLENSQEVKEESCP